MALAQDAMLEDSLLNRVREDLPEGWSMSLEGDNLEIRREDSLWWLIVRQPQDLPANWKDPYRDPETLRYDGSHGTLQVKMPVQRRWTKDELNAVRLENEQLDREEARLAIKYEIEEFYDEETNTYSPGNKKQRTRWVAYQKELDSLKNQRKEVPIYASSNFHFFHEELCDQRLARPGYVVKYLPVEAGEEFARVQQAIKKHIGKDVMPWVQGEED